ncbi:MAG: extracellular solute-binding protein, partial [Geminicoccaceae bacterium]
MPKSFSRLLGSALLAAVVTAGASAFSAAGAASGDHEGELVVYASHPSEMVDFFAQAFGEKYGISVTTVKAGTGELLNRIRAEKDRPSADIMWGGFADTGASAPDLFDPYESPELANIEPGMIDPNGYNSPFGASLMVIMYNSDILPAEDAPQRWEDLADPRWHGKVVHADPSKSSSALAALCTWLMIYGRDDA